MGLDVTYDCWSGSYGAFNVFREEIARAANIPLNLMEGYYKDDRVSLLLKDLKDVPLYVTESLEMNITSWLPIKWETLRPDPLLVLLNHSDCDGIIEVEHLLPLADRLDEITPLLPGADGKYRWNFQDKARQFALGLRDAASCGEAVEFG